MIDNKVQLRKNILAEHFDWIDEVFVTMIPEAKINEVNETQVLITDINTELDSYGNDDFVTSKSLIQVQIYFSKKSNINFNEAAKQLVHFFIVKNDYKTNGFSFFTDPDTNQISVTIKIEKIFYEEE